ncbi:MAG TPA: APC family permease [Actinomycetota bacterium]|nr:APC family permease [Actinomycetota bacterium]
MPAANEPSGRPVRRKADRQLLGRPRLGTWDAVGQAMVVGPIVSAGLAAYLLAGAAGAIAPLILLLGFAGTLSFGWAISLYARRYAGAGATYEYLSKAVSKRLGIYSSSLLLFEAPFATTAGYVALGLLWQGFLATHVGLDPGWWPGALASGVLIFFLQYLGVRLAVRTQLLLTALSAVPLLVLVGAVIASGGATGNTLGVFDARNAPDGGSLFRGVIFALLMFAGYESAATLGEETRLPHRSIPKAIFLTIGLVGTFYLLVVYAATIGLGPEAVRVGWGENPLALSLLADRYVGKPMGAVIELAVILDLIAVMTAFGNGLSRRYFALARDRLLPRLFARVSRYETPVGALAAILTYAVIGLLAASFFTDKFEMFELLTIGVTLVGMSVSLMLSVGAFRFLREEPRSLWRPVVLLAAAGVPVLGLYGTLVPFPAGPARIGLGIAVAIAVLALVWLLYLQQRRPEAVASAADYALRPDESATEAERF